MPSPINNFGAFASDPDNDPNGPTGSETRKNRHSAGRIIWPARSPEPESAINALIEYARGRQEQGNPIGYDVEIPPVGQLNSRDKFLQMSRGVPASDTSELDRLYSILKDAPPPIAGLKKAR